MMKVYQSTAAIILLEVAHDTLQSTAALIVLLEVQTHKHQIDPPHLILLRSWLLYWAELQQQRFHYSYCWYPLLQQAAVGLDRLCKTF